QALSRELQKRLGVVSELLRRELPEHAREPLSGELHDTLALDLERRAAAELGLPRGEQLAHACAACVADGGAVAEPRDSGEQREQQGGARHEAALSAASASARWSGRRITASAPQEYGSSLGRM